MDETILVTGASGFVGRALCNTFARCGLNIRAAVRDDSSGRELPCPAVCVGNIDANAEWSKALANVDAVVHLAARAHVMRDGAPDPLAAYKAVNVDGSTRLGEAALRAGVKRFVFMSSIKVNGEATSDRPFTESDEPRPLDAYGMTKLEAERRLASLCANTPMALTVLRPPLVYGPGAKGNLLALMRAVDRGLPLPLGAIHNRRSLIGIDNLVEAVRLCLLSRHSGTATYLISDDEPVSSADLVRSIAAAMGKRARLWPIPVPLIKLAGTLLGRSAAVDRLTSSLVVDSGKIRKQLGWRTVRPFDQGIADMVAAYRHAAAGKAT